MSSFRSEKPGYSRYRQTGGYKRVFRQKEHRNEVPTTPAPPLGKLIEKIQTLDLDQSSKALTGLAKIENAQSVSSYNWLDDGSRTTSILVPGKPPRWTPPSAPPFLREDDGKCFRDKNAARYPKHPMEPAVLACLETDPNIPANTDIVACGSTLGNLLRFVRGQDKTFRMLVEKISNTVFFIRRENSPRELIPDVRGYGHTFPQAYTTWDADVPGSVSHQRIISYTFAGLDLVVRFEADGYLPPPKNTPSSSPSSTTNSKSKSKSGKEPSLDDLTDMLSATNLSPKSTSPPGTIQIKKGTSNIPQDHIFDLKTRSIRSKETKDHLAEELPRLWVSQIPNFIQAFHTRGEFKTEDIQIKDVRNDITKWEDNHATDLTHLAAVIHRIIAAISTHPNGKIEVCHQEIGTLEIREQLPGAADVLSPGVRARWEFLSIRSGEGDGTLVDDKDVGEKAVNNDDSDSGHLSSDDESDADGGIEWNEKADNDFTACGVDCGYCGRCSY